MLTHPASPVGKAREGDIVPPEAIRRRGVAFEKVHTLRFGSQRRLHLRHLLTLGKFFPAFDLKKKKKKALSLSFHKILNQEDIIDLTGFGAPWACCWKGILILIF